MTLRRVHQLEGPISSIDISVYSVAKFKEWVDSASLSRGRVKRVLPDIPVLQPCYLLRCKNDLPASDRGD